MRSPRRVCLSLEAGVVFHSAHAAVSPADRALLPDHVEFGAPTILFLQLESLFVDLATG